MRQEAKEVDGFELEREEERKRETELVEEDEEELFDLDGKPEQYDREEERTGAVAGAMRKILERDHIVINDLDLDKRELKALEALKTAVDGRDPQLNGFVYAEDRRTLLEQALAVLQPDIATLEKIGGPEFEEMLKEVAELRVALNNLEEAQEEVEPHKLHGEKGEAGDTDDKPDDDDKSLTGPERKIEKPKTSLTGPEVKAEPKPASTLTGPEVKEEPKPKSSLSGPEVKEEPKPKTSLGDEKELAEIAKKPWWKRFTGD